MFLDFEIFGLEYILKHSESIPTKKIFSHKFSNVSFPLLQPFWPKNNSREKNLHGNIFQISRFSVKVCFETFWIDSEINFFDIVIFYYFGQKRTEYNIVGKICVTQFATHEKLNPLDEISSRPINFFSSNQILILSRKESHKKSSNEMK